VTMVACVHIGAALNQGFNNCGMPPLRRDVQRGKPLATEFVDARPGCNQRAHHVDMTVSRR